MAKSKTSFKKGEGGRPLGAKNKSYLDASHWLQRADQELDTLEKTDHEKRMVVIKWATELCMAKIPSIPATPNESHANAIVAQDVINKAIEDQKQKMVDQLNNADPGTTANSD
jgi:hypothetical protein